MHMCNSMCTVSKKCVEFLRSICIDKMTEIEYSEINKILEVNTYGFNVQDQDSTGNLQTD